MDLKRLAQNARTVARNRRRMETTGLTPNGYPLRNEFETGTLASVYPDYRAVVAAIKRRTRPAAYGKASRLGIARVRARTWDDNELLRLRPIYDLRARNSARNRVGVSGAELGCDCHRGERSPHPSSKAAAQTHRYPFD